MTTMKRFGLAWRASLVLATVSLVGAGCASNQGGGKSVTVIGTWGGDEQKAFLAMVKPWEDQIGNEAKSTGTRDLNAVLTTGVASGVLPDMAGLPGPGQLIEFAKGGSLKPLDDTLDMATYKSETIAPLLNLGV